MVALELYEGSNVLLGHELQRRHKQYGLHDGDFDTRREFMLVPVLVLVLLLTALVIALVHVRVRRWQCTTAAQSILLQQLVHQPTIYVGTLFGSLLATKRGAFESTDGAFEKPQRR